MDNGPDKMLGRSMEDHFGPLNLWRREKESRWPMELDQILEGDAWEGRNLFLDPEAPVLPVSAPGLAATSQVCPRRCGGKRHQFSLSADGIPSVQWELLPAPSKTAPGGWGHALQGDWEM